jgi:nucleoside-diphosphate-sugar epimerase
MTSYRIVVTGSSGFLGRRLCPLLADRGHSVVGLDLQSPPTTNDGFEHRDWNALDPPPDDLGQIDAVFLLAQSPHYRNFPRAASDLWGVNVTGTARILEAFHADRPWMFHASTGSVYQPSLEPIPEDAPLRRDDAYAASKLAAEDLIRLHDGSWTIGRFFTIYGPGQRGRMVPAIIDRVRSGRAVSLAATADENSGETSGLKISMALVDDVAELLSRLLEITLDGSQTRETLNLGPPTPASIRDIAEAAGKVLGREPILEPAKDHRTGDLIADTSRLESRLPMPWKSVEDGILRTIEEDHGSAG